MSGWLAIAGLGPGDAGLITPEVSAALEQATDIVGYGPYVARVPERSGQKRHSSDNRVELDRARHALDLAASGQRVVIVSSGDPGVFAMAAAVFEALESFDGRAPDIRVLPGITAMLAAAARIGAPLGHDFCAINLSDNLKPWDLVVHRLRHAARGGFAMAFYNPRSKSRPNQFGAALGVLRAELPGSVPVFFARAVSTDQEDIRTATLAEANPDWADMRTVVLVGTADTRQVGRYHYTKRSAG